MSLVIKRLLSVHKPKENQEKALKLQKMIIF